MSEGVFNPRTKHSKLPPLPEAVSDPTAGGETMARPRGRARQFLQRVKKGVTVQISRFKHFLSREPAQNVNHEGAPLTPNIEVRNTPSSVKEGAVPRSVVAQVQEVPSRAGDGAEPRSVDAILQAADKAAGKMKTLGAHAGFVASAAQNGPAYLDTADNIQDIYLKPLKIFDSVIEQIANVHPYAKIALGVLSYASKMVLAQADRDQAISKLHEKLGEVYHFMVQDETLRQISSMYSIMRQISEQILECAHFIIGYSETKNFWKRLGKNIASETDFTIQGYSEVLDTLMQNFRDQISRDVAIFAHRAGDILDLSGMTYAAGAGLDTREQCLTGTRTDIIRQITTWVYDSGDSERVLWLSGTAGTGKTAIAHTIANQFNNMGELGSCYCFDRHRGADRHEKIFSTIARNLADRDLEMRRALADAVQNDIALKNTTDIVQQWDKLLMKPLGKLSGSTVGPVVIVIDALDESGDAKARSNLLRILAGKLQNPGVQQITKLPNNFRFIITSRPLRDIDDEFTGAQHIRRMSMDEIPPAVAEDDIHIYVSKKLEGQSKFGKTEFAALAKKADGLFEWARLACEHIEKTPGGVDPLQRFKAIVNRDPVKRKNLLYNMYTLILTDIMGMDEYEDDEYKEVLAKFHSVMGQILATAEPLPLDSLNAMRRQFPDRAEQYGVDFSVKNLGSLLSGTTNSLTPIRPLHTSFHDFLTNPSSSGDFFVDVSKMQHNLAFASLEVMKSELSFNICDLKSSYIPNCQDTELKERVKKRIPPHLSYACRFWATHIQTTVFGTVLAKKVKNFLGHKQLLFWLEALSLINALNDAVRDLSLIPQWLEDHPEYNDVSLTVIDVQRFIQIFGGIILHSTPHLYVSALPFSPVNSAISRNFAKKFQNTLHLTAGFSDSWPAVQSVLRGHEYGVLSASFSPDGARIVTGSRDKTVRLWDAATGQPVGQPWRGHGGSVNSVSFSPDGTRVVTGSSDNTVWLWNITTGQPDGEPWRGHTGSVHSVSFSPDGTRVVTGSDDQTVWLWDAATGQPVGDPWRGHNGSVNSVSFSLDGTRIVTGSSDNTIRLWDAATGQPVGEPLRDHTGSVKSVSFSPDGTRIATGSLDITVRLWDTATGQQVGQPFLGHTGSVNSVSFSRDGSRIVTGSSDKTVRLWDAATGQPVCEPLREHTCTVNSVSFSWDGTRIVAGSSDGSVWLWDAATASGKSVCQFSCDATTASGKSAGQSLCDATTPSGKSVGQSLWEHTRFVNSVSFSPDGTRIATGSLDTTVRLWDAVTGRPVGEPMQGHTSSVRSVSFSRDGTRIVTGSWDNTVLLWDAATGQQVGQPFWGHTGSVNSVSFSPNGTYVVTGSSDKTARLWDAATGQPVGQPWQGHCGSVNSVSFSPNGTLVVTGSSDTTVRLWDAATGQQVGKPWRAHRSSISSVSFSPDGTRIMTGSLDKTARLWDTATGQQVGRPLGAKTGSINSVSFSPCGTYAATGSSDRTVRLWDTTSGQPVGEPLWGHTGLVNSISFSPDGTRIVSCSADGTIRLWYARDTHTSPVPLPQYAVDVFPAVAFHNSPKMLLIGDSATKSRNSWSNLTVRFSPSSTHALHNAAELIDGISDGGPKSTSFILEADGWMVGPDNRLLFWVPPASRQAFYSPWNALVIPRGCVELDLSRMAHGPHWQHCRGPARRDTKERLSSFDWSGSGRLGPK